MTLNQFRIAVLVIGTTSLIFGFRIRDVDDRLERIEARLPASTTSTAAATVPPPVPTTGSTAPLPDEAPSTVLPVERSRSVEPGAGCSQIDDSGACQEWYEADGPDRPRCEVSDVAPNGECGASDAMACQDAPYGTEQEPCSG